MREQKDLCIKSISELIDQRTKTQIKSRILDLKEVKTAEETLEKETLKRMAEDLDISDVSDSEDEDQDRIPQEFFEKAEMMFLRSNLQMRQSQDLTQRLNSELFNNEYFELRGLNRDLLAEKVRTDNEIELAYELYLSRKREDNKDPFIQKFKNVSCLFNSIIKLFIEKPISVILK